MRPGTRQLELEGRIVGSRHAAADCPDPDSESAVAPLVAYVRGDIGTATEAAAAPRC